MTSNLKAAYTKQKNAAKYRGIDWQLNFDEWLFIWEKSGHLSQRGRGKGMFAMARHGDIGPYATSNVEIISHEQNSSDARRNHQRSQYDLRSKRIGFGRGWTMVGRAFQVTVSRKYIGTFATQESAEVAYRNAVCLMLSSSSKTVPRVNPTDPEPPRIQESV